jgi:hypothetical protein
MRARRPAAQSTNILPEMSDLSGEFETHLTVRLADAVREMDGLRAFAATRGLKCTHIVLAAGASASQPMLTRGGRGTLAEQRRAAELLAEEMRLAGFAVTRSKIEATPWTYGVPQSEADAAAEPPGRYFEHHVKLLLAPEAHVPALIALARRHGGHLSRNALRSRDDGRHERFVTQRAYRVGAPAAHALFETLMADLRSARYEIRDAEEEYVVYDSDVTVDAGWLDVPSPQGVGS